MSALKIGEIKPTTLFFDKNSFSWLFLIVFFESIILPIPPYPFYIQKILLTPCSKWRIAFICTALSVMGGCITYIMGFFFHDADFIAHLYQYPTLETIKIALQKWGHWMIIAKCIVPLPYKIMCFVAGIVKINWYTFIFASLIARGSRFYIITFVVNRYAHYLAPLAKKYRYFFHGLLMIGMGMIVFWAIYKGMITSQAR